MKYWELKTDGNEAADLYIYGDIDSYGSDGDKKNPNRNAFEIIEQLQGLSAKSLTVHINSYGGDVKEGLAIYNTLKNSDKKITTICDGFACSIASVIFMAGTQRIMNDASLLMIHNPWTIAIGNAEDMRKQAEDLDIIRQVSVEAYKNSSALLEDEIKELMDAETWILPEQALEYGFATEVREAKSSGLKQSAMKVMMKRLTEHVVGVETEVKEETDDEIMTRLDAIAGKLDELLARGQDEDQPEDTKQTLKTGFNLFF